MHPRILRTTNVPRHWTEMHAIIGLSPFPLISVLGPKPFRHIGAAQLLHISAPLLLELQRRLARRQAARGLPFPPAPHGIGCLE